MSIGAKGLACVKGSLCGIKRNAFDLLTNAYCFSEQPLLISLYGCTDADFTTQLKPSSGHVPEYFRH